MSASYKSTRYAACFIKKNEKYFLEIADKLNLEPKTSNRLSLWTDDQIKLIADFNKKIARKFIVPDQQKKDIIHFFKTEKYNTMTIMAERFQLSTNRISNVIDEYFDNLKKQKKVKTNK